MYETYCYAFAACVERRLCGAASADEVFTGASSAPTDNISSPSRRREVFPANCQPCTLAATARRSPAFPATFPQTEIPEQ